MINNKLLEKITNEINQLSSKRYELMGRTRALEPDFEITTYKIEMWQRIRDAYLTSKEILDLSELRLNNLPPEIGKLRNLEKLDLESCGIEEFPISIGNLKNLKELNLRDNNLSFLPPQIGSLVFLEKLDLCFNTKIKELPTEFGKLVNLQELLISDNYFDENYLDKFLLTITNFTNLKLLEMVNIGISTMPPEIAKLQKLEDLDLHYNKLSEFPSEFAQLTSLKNLDLTGNDFAEIPECIYGLQNLETLYMSENSIRSIGTSISNLKQLRILTFGTRGLGLTFETTDFDASNQIKELPNSLKQLISFWCKRRTVAH